MSTSQQGENQNENDGTTKPPPVQIPKHDDDSQDVVNEERDGEDTGHQNQDDVKSVADSNVDDERSMATSVPDEELEEDEEVEGAASGSGSPSMMISTPTTAVSLPGGRDEEGEASSLGEPEISPAKKKKKRSMPPGSRGKGRTPAVKGLTIPFRTVKKAMKLDPDIPIVQNEAAIMTTLAAELFIKSLARETHVVAKKNGRNTIRYEDVAEARTKDPALGFLTSLFP